MGPKFVALVLLAVGTPLLAAAPPLAVHTGATGVESSAFRVTAFASNLPYYPTGFLQLPDGSYLVAANDPGPTGYYSSTGRLIRLTDDDHDGVADDAGTTLASNLPGAIVQMRLAGDLLIVNSARTNANSISIYRVGLTPSSPMLPVGTLNLGFTSGYSHASYALAVRPEGEAGDFGLYFNLGSRLNAANTTATVNVTGLNNSSWVLQTESIYRVTLTNTGPDVAVTSPTLIARGLRNAAGLAFHPVTGDLYIQDNGIDGSPDPNIPLSADEINVIPAAQIGVGPVPNFGFATDYIRYADGVRVGSGGVQPLVAIRAHASPAGGTSHAQGAAEITFAPANFPDGLNSGLFVGFHGRFHQAGLANDENPVLYIDPAAGTYFDFLANELPSIGHIDNVYASADALFLVDFNSLGPVNSTTPSGAIYQITVIPEPAAFLAILIAAPAFWRPRRPMKPVAPRARL